MADMTKNLEGSWKQRSQRSKDKAVAAINALHEEGKPINFNSVYMRSGVSKSFLYDDKEIKEMIEKCRQYQTEKKANWHKKYDKTSDSKDVIIEAKDKRIKKLEAENAKLKQEIDVLRGLIYSSK